MKRNLWTLVWALGFIPAFMSCRASDEEKISECTEDFAAGYFNLDFNAAAEHCTPESMKWLTFRGSNITSQDIEVFNAKPHATGVSVTEVKLLNDSSARVRCVVDHVVATDSIEQEQGHTVSQQQWIIPLVKRENRWLVKMEAPLQNAE